MPYHLQNSIAQPVRLCNCTLLTQAGGCWCHDTTLRPRSILRYHKHWCQDIPVVVAISQANMCLASCAQQGCSMSPEFAVRFVKFEGNATPQVGLTQCHLRLCSTVTSNLVLDSLAACRTASVAGVALNIFEITVPDCLLLFKILMPLPGRYRMLQVLSAWKPACSI